MKRMREALLYATFLYDAKVQLYAFYTRQVETHDIDKKKRKIVFTSPVDYSPSVPP